MEPGELEGLEAMHHAYPDRYIPVSEDSVGVTVFNGSSFVWNCPCRSLDKIEQLFWINRKAIIAYYQERTQRELKEAADTAAAIDGLPKGDDE